MLAYKYTRGSLVFDIENISFYETHTRGLTNKVFNLPIVFYIGQYAVNVDNTMRKEKKPDKRSFIIYAFVRQ
jgi:hypothetical protein